MRGVVLALVLAGIPVSAHAEESIGAFMERYELALDRGDTRLLRDIYAEWTSELEAKLSHYFRSVIAEQNVEFSEVVVEQPAEDRARVRFVRRDRFTDQRTGERVEKRILLEKALLLRDGHWMVTRAK